MYRDGEYLTSNEMGLILKKNKNMIFQYACRSEMSKYRKEEGRNLYILNCKEARKILREYIKSRRH